MQPVLDLCLQHLVFQVLVKPTHIVSSGLAHGSCRCAPPAAADPYNRIAAAQRLPVGGVRSEQREILSAGISIHGDIPAELPLGFAEGHTHPGQTVRGGQGRQIHGPPLHSQPGAKIHKAVIGSAIVDDRAAVHSLGVSASCIKACCSRYQPKNSRSGSLVSSQNKASIIEGLHSVGRLPVGPVQSGSKNHRYSRTFLLFKLLTQGSKKGPPGDGQALCGSFFFQSKTDIQLSGSVVAAEGLPGMGIHSQKPLPEIRAVFTKLPQF